MAQGEFPWTRGERAAEYCRAGFAERASDVTLREFGTEVEDHSTSVTLSLPLALEQFGALRQMIELEPS